MDKQQAAKDIAEKLAAAKALLEDCVRISDESGVGFDLPWGGEGTSENGIGAYYSPEGDDAKWRRIWDERSGWNPSAHSC